MYITPHCTPTHTAHLLHMRWRICFAASRAGPPLSSTNCFNCSPSMRASLSTATVIVAEPGDNSAAAQGAPVCKKEPPGLSPGGGTAGVSSREGMVLTVPASVR